MLAILLFLQSFAFSALAQLNDDPNNDIFSPEMYDSQREDLITSMTLDIYMVKAPIDQAVAYQIGLIDSVASSLKLPTYFELLAKVVEELQCSNKFEAEPKKAAAICEDRYCAQCSWPRREFYNYLKLKVFVNERALMSLSYEELDK